LIAGVLGKAGGLGQKRRLREAENGKVTWQLSEDIYKFLKEKRKQEAGSRDEDVDGQLRGEVEALGESDVADVEDGSLDAVLLGELADLERELAEEFPGMQ